MSHEQAPKSLEMQPALLEAAIDVLNGMSLMDSYRKHRANITIGKAKQVEVIEGTCKDLKGGVDPAYGLIRHSVMRLCTFRNKRKFEELRDRDANKPKDSVKKTASDVSYETLQLYAHYFLTSAEMARFEENLQADIEVIDVLSESKESHLLAQQRLLTSRIRRIERSMRECGIIRDGTLIEIQSILERLDGIDTRIALHCEKLKAALAVTKAGKRHQSARRNAEFERGKCDRCCENETEAVKKTD